MLKKLGFEDITRCCAFEGNIIKDSEINKWQQKQYANACVRGFLKALSIKNPPFVIFEDDAQPFKYNLDEDIYIPDDADFIYLGGSSERFEKKVCEITMDHPFLTTENENILIVKNNMTNLHAFMVMNEKTKEYLIKELSNNLFLIQDLTVAKMQTETDLKFYAYNPPMFFQEGENSKNPYLMVK